MERKPRILAIAYACMPGAGSESGAGFAWARILAGLGETWVLTRRWPARSSTLLATAAAIPEAPNLHIVEIDLPPWLGSQDWDPVTSSRQQVEYLAWQGVALREARALVRRHEIDLVWHLTYANIWMGSIGGTLGKAFVLGPVGGGVGPPWQLLSTLGWRGAGRELVRSVTRSAARWMNPLARMAWSRAGLILVQNRETRAWLPRSARSRTYVLNNVAFEEELSSRTRRPRPDAPVAIFAGRLLPLKGVSLAISTMARLPSWRLVLLGSGPDEPRLRAISAKLGVANRVDFRGWQDRSEVLRAMREDADVFLFPSLHEEGGWAVSEALAIGLPVVCLDRGGPPLMVGRGVATSGEAETVRRLARELTRAAEAAPTKTSQPTVERRREELIALLRRTDLAYVLDRWK